MIERKMLFSSGLISAFILVSTFIPAASSFASPDEPNSCLVCHEFMGGEVALPATEWMGSTHQSMGILCTYCHGGDETVDVSQLEGLSPEEVRALAREAMYSQDDFVAQPNPVEMFEMCGQCHDESVMIYRESIMGRTYLEKRGGPSCTRCHGAHMNYIPDVPESCEDCHKDVLGFDKIESMNVTLSTIDLLYEIRLEEASKKIVAVGKDIFPEELDSFEIGFVTWGMILFLVLMSVILYRTMEK